MDSLIIDYLSRGFSLVPVPLGAKRPALPWQEFQNRRASEDELSEQFGRMGEANVAIVTGS